MTEQQSPYNLTVPVYPVIATITNGPTPCASCGGVVTPDPESPDLQLCTACGLRRMRPTAKPAAATGPAAIHRLMDEVLTTLLDVAADPSHLDEYAADVRTRLDALIGGAS